MIKPLIKEKRFTRNQKKIVDKLNEIIKYINEMKNVEVREYISNEVKEILRN